MCKLINMILSVPVKMRPIMTGIRLTGVANITALTVNVIILDALRIALTLLSRHKHIQCVIK
jgi:hypothetical protein